MTPAQHKANAQAIEQAAKQTQLQGLARQIARVLITADLSRDELIQRLALAQAQLELERTATTAQLKLIGPLTAAAVKQGTQGEGGNSTREKADLVKEWIIKEYQKYGKDYLGKRGKPTKDAFADAYGGPGGLIKENYLIDQRTRDGKIIQVKANITRTVPWVKKNIKG